MASLVEVKEPYVRVHERIITAALNPTAGEDLIIGCAIISDSGPSIPTLISSQKEYLATYSSQDITSEYVNKMNQLYKGDDKTLAATMWLNGYRLAGSNTLLCVRASKAKDINFVKPLVKGDNNVYLLRDGQLLKKVASFKLVISENPDSADHAIDGWGIAINGIGVIGNANSDEGPEYDYYVGDLKEFVDYLNDTNMFFSPAYTFYNSATMSDETETDDPKEAKAVVFEEVYVGADLIDTTDERCVSGFQNLVACKPETTDLTQPSLNLSEMSKFEPAESYAINEFNSSNDLKVRIRRFNHDAVLTKELDKPDANQGNGGKSPYTVIKKVLDTFTATGTKTPKAEILERDFYEVAVFDPSLSSEPLYFNLGNIQGRGDMTVAELNESLKMIRLNLPDDLNELKLNYFGYAEDDNYMLGATVDEEGQTVAGTIETAEELYVNIGIDPTKYHVLDVSDDDIMKAFDQIEEDEVYVTEGLADLGCTSTKVQNYIANMAVNSNYFYPVSTVNSTNYLTIANSLKKIPQDSNKLYACAPWDVDSGTVGFKYYCSPDVMYWETVGRNKLLGREFAPCLGQTNGVAQFQKPVVEFNKKTRQLLLSRRINTVLWNTSTNAYNWNDNYTKCSEDSVIRDDGNSRLMIRISKAMPVLLKQFIGRRINSVLWTDARNVIDFWFKNNIMPMSYTIDNYIITINETNNPVEIQRQNKMQVLVEVRYQRALKYVEVYNQAYDMGMPFTGQIVK